MALLSKEAKHQADLQSKEVEHVELTMHQVLKKSTFRVCTSQKVELKETNAWARWNFDQASPSNHSRCTDEDRALQIIETALADKFDILGLVRDGFAEGNRELGDLFESGKLSLPELIYSTEVMKRFWRLLRRFPEQVWMVSKESASCHRGWGCP